MAESNPTTGVRLLMTGFGGYEKMKLEPISCPSKETLNPDCLVVHIRANGINFAELMCLQGLYDRTPKPPCVLGFEGSGDVVMVGGNVTKFKDVSVLFELDQRGPARSVRGSRPRAIKPGDRVVCVSSSFGLWAEFCSVPEVFCFAIPASMSYEEAAALPVNYVTAHHMLFNFGGLRPGQSVLVHMAAGGVGIAATQLCKTVKDVTVFGTCSKAKHDAVRQHGVTYPIDYRTQDYAEEIRKIQPRGVDIVLDPLNGADSVKGFELLKPLGKIIHFGAASAVSGPSKSYWSLIKLYFAMNKYSPLSLMPQNRAVCGYHMGYIEDVELITSTMHELLSLYEQGLIKPQIDSVWAYSEVSQAMGRMYDRINVGKVIITPQKKT